MYIWDIDCLQGYSVLLQFVVHLVQLYIVPLSTQYWYVYI